MASGGSQPGRPQFDGSEAESRAPPRRSAFLVLCAACVVIPCLLALAPYSDAVALSWYGLPVPLKLRGFGCVVGAALVVIVVEVLAVATRSRVAALCLTVLFVVLAGMNLLPVFAEDVLVSVGLLVYAAVEAVVHGRWFGTLVAWRSMGKEGGSCGGKPPSPPEGKRSWADLGLGG